ncbi:MAG: hypothetical protein HY924_13660 [Elusimicrobia bacterium]|nr:hypothetical protein [Elusimicrobiota bacterium]
MPLNVLFSFFLAAALCGPAHADQFGGFQQFADSGALKPFARDIGAVLGSSSFHSGRPLGFSGFDVGFRGGMLISPDKRDKIMRDNGIKGFGMPWVQAEVGLPMRFDVFIRGASFEGLTVSGGGLRWGVFKGDDKPWAFQILLSGLGHAFVHQHFSGVHAGANIVASTGNQYVVFYAGPGFDWTRLVARSSTLEPAIAGQVAHTFEYRGTAGIKIKPFAAVTGNKLLPYLYVSGGYVIAHGEHGAESALGIRF